MLPAVGGISAVSGLGGLASSAQSLSATGVNLAEGTGTTATPAVGAAEGTGAATAGVGAPEGAGAIAPVQAGGEGLSGTGPKAGGPHYLLRFATERVTSINTTAVGGNTSLLMATSSPRFKVPLKTAF